MMKIVVKINENNYNLDANENDKIIDIKTKIEKRHKIPIEDQVLLSEGSYLEDDNTLKKYSIGDRKVISLKLIRSPQTDSASTLEQATDNDCTILSDGNKPSRPKPESATIETSSESPPNNDLTKDVKNCPGVCVVISNRNFPTLTTREGTDCDEKRIKETFEKFNYRIEVYKDVKSTEIDDKIKEIKSKVDKAHRILVIFLLSHGLNGGIYFADGIAKDFETIWDPFTNANFPSLVGKPKLFFFGCCQGNDANIAVEAHHVPITESRHEFDNDNTKIRYPATSCMFFGYATFKKFVSIRVTDKGTYYIQALCDSINDHPEKSISDIHQEAQNIVSKQPIRPNNDLQMPYFTNLLIEPAYLHISPK